VRVRTAYSARPESALTPSRAGVESLGGGCRIGNDATRGVVDEYGHVFDASAPGKYYDGLYVVDASIIPSALGVNPSLTISALALRIGQQIATEMSA
jgi:choline dehydrogenase-like flavoprotein